jgi:hypothetical protein
MNTSQDGCAPTHKPSWYETQGGHTPRLEAAQAFHVRRHGCVVVRVEPRPRHHAAVVVLQHPHDALQVVVGQLRHGGGLQRCLPHLVRVVRRPPRAHPAFALYQLPGLAPKQLVWDLINPVSTFALNFNKPFELTIKPDPPLLGAGGRVRLYTVKLFLNPYRAP